MPLIGTIRFICFENTGYTALIHFMSEKFAMTVSLKDCAPFVKLFYKINGRAPIALQKFRVFKGMKKALAR